MAFEELQKFAKEFPKQPGVYVMRNAAGEVLYVGKATDLRSRVASYFSREANSRYQVQFLMSKVAAIEPVVTDNAKEALLLENTLIKKHRPRYNIQLKDDKSYVSVKLSIQDKFPRIYVTRRLRKDGGLYFGPYTSAGGCREIVEFIEKYFQLRTCNDADFRNRARPCLQYQIHRCGAPCVGYVQQEEYGKMVKRARLFLEGKNEPLKREINELMRQASERQEFESAARYRDAMQAIDRIFARQKVVSHEPAARDVIGLHREGALVCLYLMMVREGSLQDHRSFFFKTHEENGELLVSFLMQYYEAGKHIPSEILLPLTLESESSLAEILAERRGKKVEVSWPQRGDKSALLSLANQNAAQTFERRQQKQRDVEEILCELQERLELKRLPRRIECYDISNFQGRDSVGSMVCFVDGQAHRAAYRHFKIKTVEGSNDFASIYEVITRRLRQGLKAQGTEDSEWTLPDLIVIDGGKGQLQAAAQAFKDLDVREVDLVSLAKSRLEGNESPVEKTDVDARQRSEERVFLQNRKDPLFFPKNSSALFLLVQLRDEAHRFGIEHHRKQRKAKTTLSGLDKIEGIGTARKRRLLKHFGSVKRIQQASVEEIAGVMGGGEELANRLKREISIPFSK